MGIMWVGEYLPGSLRPILVLSTAAYHFIVTVLLVAFVERRPSKLFKLTELRHRSFARLWSINGEAMSVDMPGRLDELLAKCSGIVLDIGPGSGEMLSRFDASKIHVMYGAEPAVDLHPSLLRSVEKNGLMGKYHALLCGGEPESLIPALHRSHVLGNSGTGGTAENGIFDEICCVRVLCGVPHMQETIKGLYALLKPGGRMVIYEHVVNPWRTEGSLIARIMQVVFTSLGWPFFMGGCELQRHTDQCLGEAGEWDVFRLEYVSPKDAIPFIMGELVKSGRDPIWTGLTSTE